MHPASVVAGEEQGDALAMQGQVVRPGEVVGQCGAVQLGSLAQLTGELTVGQRRVAQGLTAVLVAGAMLVSAANFLAIGQCKQAL